MATQLQKSSGTRWFSTGFMAGGVESVDAGTHTLRGAVLVRPGEAMGHGVWIDKDFCRAVAAMSANGKPAQAGLKARFGHPNMCSDALGTFLGRWKNIVADESGFVRGDLHLSSTASESPNGDLRKYVEEMAAKEPDHFGASIVFTCDREAEEAFYAAHQVEVATEGGGKAARFQSPDPDNIKNLPHARLSELHAADLVDDPAATDGMFSGASGAALAAQMTEWLDLHPEVFAALQEPGIGELVARHADKLQPFLSKYAAVTSPPAEPESVPVVATEDKSPESPAAESATTEPVTPAAEPAGLSATVNTLTARVSVLDAEVAQLSGEKAAAVQRADTAEAANAALSKEREELIARLKQVEAEKATAAAERDEAQRKLSIIASGQPPVSSVPAESQKTGTLMERARANKK